MQIRRSLLTWTVLAPLLLAMGPMPAPIYMNVPAGETLRTKISLPQAAQCDDGVRLEKGSYDAVVKSLGDGSVRVTISGNGKTGHVTGKVQGHEVVVQGGLQPGAANSVVVEGGRQPSFASMGFTPQSQVSPQISGNRLNLVIKGQGANAILVGLSLPAVQKVREAANQPGK